MRQVIQSTNIPNDQLVFLQLSYSTADIEHNTFYREECKPLEPQIEPAGKATLLVVHGELYALEENVVPSAVNRLNEASGIFQIVGVAG